MILGATCLYPIRVSCCLSKSQMCRTAPVHAQVQQRTLTRVLQMASEADLRLWQRLDDVIMGGQSASSLQADAEGGAVFSGTLVLEGGGFCGARTNVRSLPAPEPSLGSATCP